jgi:TetR/AcrR family transcriptional regulator
MVSQLTRDRRAALKPPAVPATKRPAPRHRRHALPEAGSRERLLAAAALEFAARGFDGAKVDRIAERAGINKAMLYYHFADKAALYRDILDAQFGALAGTLRDERPVGAAPEDEVRWFIRTVAAALAANPHFPSIWLREMAEGGAHLQTRTITSMTTVIGTLAGILARGRDAGVFRDVPPFITQLGIVGPLLMFAASAPIRARITPSLPEGVPSALINPPDEIVLAHIERATLAAIAAPAATGGEARQSRRSQRP